MISKIKKLFKRTIMDEYQRIEPGFDSKRQFSKVHGLTVYDIETMLLVLSEIPLLLLVEDRRESFHRLFRAGLIARLGGPESFSITPKGKQVFQDHLNY